MEGKKEIKEMGLPNSIANIFAARNIITAEDALSLTEFELMELLDVGLIDVRDAISKISETACPPYQTVLSLMEQRMQHGKLPSHFPTRLKGLDDCLCGGIPYGVLTELVGPAGIGKTQFCLNISLLAALPKSYGGLDGHVVYIDVESKFSPKRVIEIGAKCFPEYFLVERLGREIFRKIIVLRPTSVLEFSKSLEQVKAYILKKQVKLLVIDSMAALVFEECLPKQSLGWHVSFLKSLAQSSRIPVIVTNQVRSVSGDAFRHVFQDNDEATDKCERLGSRLIPALGVSWAHAVTVRLVLETISGRRFIKVTKSPISRNLMFPFIITMCGFSLTDDNGVEVAGTEINTIHFQGGHNISKYS